MYIYFLLTKIFNKKIILLSTLCVKIKNLSFEYYKIFFLKIDKFVVLFSKQSNFSFVISLIEKYILNQYLSNPLFFLYKTQPFVNLSKYSSHDLK